MKFKKAKIDEENKYNYEVEEIAPNVWITETPYSIQQNVFIQDYGDNVSFSWVGSNIVQDENGLYKISGLYGGYGAKPVKCWMKVPFPHEDFTGWHSEYVEDVDFPRKKNHQYLVCVEVQEYGRTTYELRITKYSHSKNSEWLGYDIHNRARNVIAWRELPRPTRKIFR